MLLLQEKLQTLLLLTGEIAVLPIELQVAAIFRRKRRLRDIVVIYPLYPAAHLPSELRTHFHNRLIHIRRMEYRQYHVRRSCPPAAFDFLPHKPAIAAIRHQYDIRKYFHIVVKTVDLQLWIGYERRPVKTAKINISDPVNRITHPFWAGKAGLQRLHNRSRIEYRHKGVNTSMRDRAGRSNHVAQFEVNHCLPVIQQRIRLLLRHR